jgi:hypothetical protein
VRLHFAGGTVRCKRARERASESSTPSGAQEKTSQFKVLPRWPRLLYAMRAWLTPAH